MLSGHATPWAPDAGFFAGAIASADALRHALGMSGTLPHLPELLDAFYGRPTAGALHALPPNLSTRRYHRFYAAYSGAPSPTKGGPSLIVMQLPDDGPQGPSREQARAFIDVQHFLATQRIAVPEIYAHDLPNGLMLLEDLGDETFERRLRARAPEAWQGLYTVAIDLLARLHALYTPERTAADCIAFGRRYDVALLRSELDHFREWGVDAMHAPLSAADRSELDGHFDALTSAIAALPLGLVHRDYQSRNLVWAPVDRLTVLDFQDAFIGPAAYDLVALLCDSYVELSAELQSAMLARYAAQRGFSASAGVELLRAFRLITVQRKLKDAGRFVFIDRVRKNPDFLVYYPGSLAYVARALRALPEFAGLHALLTRCVPGYPA
jgi:aminoglycoside/choline kinase family phosphotransferase